MEIFDKFKSWILILSICLISELGHGFYLPGSYPHKYEVGDQLSVKVNSLTSIDTEIPYSYYSLPFCKPPEGVKDSAENLGDESGCFDIDELCKSSREDSGCFRPVGSGKVVAFGGG